MSLIPGLIGIYHTNFGDFLDAIREVMPDETTFIVEEKSDLCWQLINDLTLNKQKIKDLGYSRYTFITVVYEIQDNEYNVISYYAKEMMI